MKNGLATDLRDATSSEYLSNSEKAQVVRNALKQLCSQRIEASINLTLNRVRIETNQQGKSSQIDDVLKFRQTVESLTLGIKAIEEEFADLLAVEDSGELVPQEKDL